MKIFYIVNKNLKAIQFRQRQSCLCIFQNDEHTIRSIISTFKKHYHFKNNCVKLTVWKFRKTTRTLFWQKIHENTVFIRSNTILEWNSRSIFSVRENLSFFHTVNPLLVFGTRKEDQGFFLQKRPYGKILGNGPYVTNILMPQCVKAKIVPLTRKIFRQNSSQCNFIII